VGEAHGSAFGASVASAPHDRLFQLTVVFTHG